MKKRIIAVMLMFVLLSSFSLMGCFGKNYSDYFSVDKISPHGGKGQNGLQFIFSVTNKAEDNDLSFSIKFGEEKKSLGVAPGEKTSEKFLVDIGKPESYDLSFDVTYTVSKSGDEVWEKTEKIPYNCKDMFVHKATIKYKSQVKEVEIVDYQEYIFDLTELFSGFNEKKVHNVNGDAYILKDKDKKKGEDVVAEGKYLYFSAWDDWRRPNNSIITVKEATKASDVNWNKYIKFSRTADKMTNYVDGYGIGFFKLHVKVNNRSDEDVEGCIERFYVNNTPLDKEYNYKYDDGYGTTIKARKKGDLDFDLYSHMITDTVGSSSVYKFGIKVVLKNSKEKVVFNKVLWLNL